MSDPLMKLLLGLGVANLVLVLLGLWKTVELIAGLF